MPRGGSRAVASSAVTNPASGPRRPLERSGIDGTPGWSLPTTTTGNPAAAASTWSIIARPSMTSAALSKPIRAEAPPASTAMVSREGMAER